MKPDHRNPFHLGFLLVGLCLVAGCNLQSQPRETEAPTSEPTLNVTQAPLVTPTNALPPLQATPTQLPLFGQPTVAVTTTINVIGNPNITLPTRFDPALADQRFEVEARSDGETIGIVYEVTINTGSVFMVLQGVDGIVWQMTLTASENSRADVSVPKAGVYELLIDAQNLSGGYNFRFE